MKKQLVIAIGLLFIMFLSACQSKQAEVPVDVIDWDGTITLPSEGDIVEARARYNNKFNEDFIPDQWEDYGVGDPYILRYNGKYYLYASTKDFNNGVRAWVSDDLIHWEKVSGNGLREGYVSEDPITTSAYAPEVIHWNGAFYMYTSPAGNGHYILKSDSPIGPFVAVTGNLGQSIDGHVFIDDDEQMYFLRSDFGGIKIHQMDNPTSIGIGRNISITSMGNWTEGPTLIKRNGMYYLTYTGTHIMSEAYRINYATATERPGSGVTFTVGPNNPTLLNTEEQFKGLGHNSIVMGPDMDSYHIIYHNLNNRNPNRSFNINRLIFNGTRMSVLGPTLSGAQVPKLPEFFAANTSDSAKFTKEADLTLSTEASKRDYTAEFNFSGSDDVVFISSYQDNKNYLYVTVSFEQKQIQLIEVKNGKTRIADEGTLINSFDVTKLHTIRIAVRNNKADVYFDNMNKITQASVSFSGGTIGYQSSASKLTLHYTAFSNVAQGLSDELEPKIVPGVIEANSFLPNGEQANAPRVTLIEEPERDFNKRYYDKAHAVSLNHTRDEATYLIDVLDAGQYGFELFYHRDNQGKKIGIQIDEASVMVVKLPEVDTDTRYIKSLVTCFDLPKGIHTLRIIQVGDELEYVSFDLFKSNNKAPQFEHTLDERLEQGGYYKTRWELKDNGHYSPLGKRSILYLGNNEITDFTLEVTLKVSNKKTAETAGILFRSKNQAINEHENNASVQGYYVGFNKDRIVLHKYDYNLSKINQVLTLKKPLDPNTYYNIQLTAKGNVMTLTIDGEEIFSYVDPYPFSYGQIALATEGADAIYKDLKITK